MKKARYAGEATNWFEKMIELSDGTLYTPSSFIRALLNESTVRIYIGPSDQKVYSAQDTVKINGQISRMSKDFSNWLRREHSEEMEQAFNESQNRYAYAPIEDPGEIYEIPGLSKDRKPWTHQRRALFRWLLQGNMGLFHAVSAGKTMTMMMIAAEGRRLGLVNKPVLVVPLSIQKQFAREAQQLFPMARILVADELSEGSGSEKGRSEDIGRFVGQVAATDWDAVIMNKDQFKRIRLSPEAQIRELETEFSEAMETWQMAREEGTSRKNVKKMEAAMDRIKARIGEEQRRATSGRDAGFTFEDTGIDSILVDEAHNYKNLKVNSSIQEAALVGSNVARDLKQKVNDLEYRGNPGRSIVLATGTAITNRIAEIHTVFRYLNDSQLKESGSMHLFDNWRRQYSEIESRLEQKSTGQWLPTSRMRFNNLVTLQRYLWNVSDIVTEEELGVVVKKPKKIVINEFGEVNPLLWQKFMDWIVERHDRIQKREPIRIGSPEAVAADTKGDLGEDNHLMLYMDTMLASVDMRFIDDTLPENPNGSLPTAARLMSEIYQDTAANEYPGSKVRGGAQIAFIDSYERPAWGSRFDAVSYLKSKLIENGVKEEEIGLVRDAGSDRSKRQDLFDRAKRGEIRILISNRKTAGEGVNVQDRMTDGHHLTVPYRPADLVQSEGRPWRVGNRNKKVTIHRWGTKGAMASSWDMIDRKARTLSGLVSNEPVTEYSAEDIGNEVGADEIASIILQSPNLKIRAELRRKIQDQAQEREDLESAWASANNTLNFIPRRSKNFSSGLGNLNLLKSLLKNTRRGGVPTEYIRGKTTRLGRILRLPWMRILERVRHGRSERK